MNAHMKSLCLAIIGGALFAGSGHAAPVPRVFSLDPQRLVLAKARLATNDAALLPALGRVRREADKAPKATPGSVMEKSKTPPSGDKHDYFSLAPYFAATKKWPDRQIKEVHCPDAALAALLRRARVFYPGGNYAALLQPAAAELAPSRFQLLWL